MGNAWEWWYAADHKYERGYIPAPGAVMVFSRTARMHVGHVAVVREFRGPREIIIDQANWHHGRIEHGTSVRDTSPNNDWSQVEVQWQGSTYGGSFPITGFIYAPGTQLPTMDSARAYTRDTGPHLVEASAHQARGHVVLAGGRTLSVTTTRSGHVAQTASARKASKPGVIQAKAISTHHAAKATRRPTF